MRTIVVGFIAGFLSILIFHQLGFYITNQLGLTRAAIYSMNGVPPFGVPAILSSAFWGGLWGIVAAYVVPRLPAALDGPVGWVLFAAIAVTIVNWFVVLPIKGAPVGGGFRMPGVIMVPVVYAFWGLGMWVFAGLTRRAMRWA
jgi:hypothetical protein